MVVTWCALEQAAGLCCGAHELVVAQQHDETLKYIVYPLPALQQVSYLEEQLRTMNPDLTAIAAYKAKAADCAARAAELKAATDERDEVRRSGGWPRSSWRPKFAAMATDDSGDCHSYSPPPSRPPIPCFHCLPVMLFVRYLFTAAAHATVPAGRLQLPTHHKLTCTVHPRYQYVNTCASSWRRPGARTTRCASVVWTNSWLASTPSA